MCKHLKVELMCKYIMYVYLSTTIVEESKVHTNIASHSKSQGIEKQKRTPLLAWPHRESNKEIETCTLACNKNFL